ncbi:hypothetical protein [Tumebacillus lipolyticus]|uniref:Uncharacterized protein n=1 Tax=Tumebacillus lipolyticus TaxID=1280370 RepID=A0ABW4ZUQ0_9BACL
MRATALLRKMILLQMLEEQVENEKVKLLNELREHNLLIEAKEVKGSGVVVVFRENGQQRRVTIMYPKLSPSAQELFSSSLSQERTDR